MLLHSTASQHSFTINHNGNNERRIETPNDKSLGETDLKEDINGSDWNKIMPTAKSPSNEEIETNATDIEHVMDANTPSISINNSKVCLLEPLSDECLKTPNIFQKISYEISDHNEDDGGDDDDECDIPELVEEDDSILASIRLDILHPEPASVSAVSDVPTSISSAPSPQTLFATQQPFGTSRPTNSILKTSITTSGFKNKKNNGPTPRRIRGMWDVNIIISGDSESDTADNKTMKKKKTPNVFSQLRDETIIHCLSFLAGEPIDLLAVSQVGRRFHSLVTTSLSLWRTVDATNFVHQQFNQHSNSGEATTKTLAKLLLKYPPETLIIRDIGDKLHADESFLPPAGRLKNLTLTHFEDLTDTHVHVLLLLLALPVKQYQKKKLVQASSSSLQQLSLEYCPKLTNATVRSIASSPSCVELQSLSIRGNSGISDLLPIAKLLQIKPGTTVPTLRPRKPSLPNPLASLFGGPPAPSTPKPPRHSPPAGLNSLFAPPPPKPGPPAGLNSLFAPPPPKPAPSAAGLNSLFAPPPPKLPVSTMELHKTAAHSVTASPPRTSALHSLFAPPGSSPQRNQSLTTTPTATTNTTTMSLPKTTIIKRGISNSTSHATIPSLGRNTSKSSTRALCTIDIRSTGIKPQSWLQCCQETTTSSSCKLWLQSFAMDGDSWTDQLLKDWADLVSLRDLKVLNLATAIANGGVGNGGITDTKVLEGATWLQSLNLNGHNVSDTTTTTIDQSNK